MKKLITIITVVFLLSIMVGVTAFAEEPVEDVSENDVEITEEVKEDIKDEAEEIEPQETIEESEEDPADEPEEDIEDDNPDEELNEEVENDNPEEEIDEDIEDGNLEEEIENPSDEPEEEPEENPEYTVDLTYEENTVNINGDTTGNLLSDVLKEIRIEDKIVDAKAYQDVDCTILAENGEVRDENNNILFRVYLKDEDWYIDTVNPFSTEHGLLVKTVKADSESETEYKIKVTDDVSYYYYLKPVYNRPGDATSGIGEWETDARLVSTNTPVLNIYSTTWGTPGTETWYVLGYNLNLENVTVRGNVHLILLDGNTLTVKGSNDSLAGINVSGDSKLTIYVGSRSSTIDGTAKLTVTGNSMGAGIGGGNGQSGSYITINGGTVTAYGCEGGAGIGGGNRQSGSHITINGGTVSAYGGEGGAGIGGGAYGSGSYITINGGTVTATGKNNGAGIGGGYDGEGYNITINGGTVTATGNGGGAGIGGSLSEEASNIYIHGGAVTAVGGSGSPGIGCGSRGFSAGYIGFSGGTVTAIGGTGSVGIGVGRDSTGHSAKFIYASETLSVVAGEGIDSVQNITHDNKTDLATDTNFNKAYVKIGSGVNQLIISDQTVVTEKVYDGTTVASITIGTVIGIASVHEVTVTATAEYNTADVGTNKTITISYTLSGKDKDKYAAPADNKSINNGIITKKQLTVTGTSVDNKVYDGNTNAKVADNNKGTLTGMVSGDTVSISSVKAVFADADVGQGKTVTVTYTLTGTNAGNYTASTTDTITADISPKMLEVVGTTADGKTYDGNRDATAHIGTTINGIVGTDDVKVAINTALFVDKNVGNGKDVTVSYTLSGAKAGNYTISNSSTSADISKRKVTITSASTSKVYDGTVLTSSEVSEDGDGFVSGEGVIYDITGSQKTVGSSKNTFTYEFGSGTEAGNYNITKNEGTLTVTPAELTLKGVKVAEKMYDGSTSAKITNKGELVGTIYPGDTVIIDKCIAEFKDPEAGNNKPVIITLTVSGTGFENYIITIEDVFANITPIPAQEGIVIEEVEETILTDAQAKAAETFESNIINYVQCSFRGSKTGYANQAMTFKTELLKGHDASTVHVWHIAEDGTMTEVDFDINDKGEIVIINGLLGLYVITE